VVLVALSGVLSRSEQPRQPSEEQPGEQPGEQLRLR
jgi:hypothetical protein